MKAAFICSEDLWSAGFPDWHPLRPERLRRTYELLGAYRAFDDPASDMVSVRPITRSDLLLFHTPEYITAVETLSRGESRALGLRYGFIPQETPPFAGMYEIEGLKASGSLIAAQLVAQREVDVAFNFSGGMHHAGPAHASGFCIFNDPAIAIQWLVRQGFRVAYVDIDAHHGDGVQNAFYDTDQVLTISLHQAGMMFFPGTGFPEEVGEDAGYGYSINVPFLAGSDEKLMLWAFRQVVPSLVGQFAPDVLVTQLGVDGHYRDPLPLLGLTTRGYAAMIEELATLAGRAAGWVALGGGGYDIDVVARAWTLAYGVMSGQEFSNDLPAEYAARYGPGHLHDEDGPALVEPRVADRTRGYVERVLETLRALTGDVWRWD
ncbi:MAG: acetoin utilization protein AcuC [Anaerolineae bacterium]|nr:acetoin utilization protein AcuC [Anaerolineae bacterium]